MDTPRLLLNLVLILVLLGYFLCRLNKRISSIGSFACPSTCEKKEKYPWSIRTQLKAQWDSNPTSGALCLLYRPSRILHTGSPSGLAKSLNSKSDGADPPSPPTLKYRTASHGIKHDRTPTLYLPLFSFSQLFANFGYNTGSQGPSPRFSKRSMKVAVNGPVTQELQMQTQIQMQILISRGQLTDQS